MLNLLLELLKMLLIINSTIITTYEYKACRIFCKSEVETLLRNLDEGTWFNV